MSFYNFPVVLFGFKTWSFTLTVERIVRVLKNRVLRRIYGPKREEVRGEWRRLDNEELNDLRSPPNTIRVMKSRRLRWTGLLARMRERRGRYRALVGKT
jgi:hypothetical protein